MLEACAVAPVSASYCCESRRKVRRVEKNTIKWGQSRPESWVFSLFECKAAQSCRSCNLERPHQLSRSLNNSLTKWGINVPKANSSCVEKKYPKIQEILQLIRLHIRSRDSQLSWINSEVWLSNPLDTLMTSWQVSETRINHTLDLLVKTGVLVTLKTQN